MCVSMGYVEHSFTSHIHIFIVCVCEGVSVSEFAHLAKKAYLITLELELQVVVSHLLWILGR